jgi:hypothetical protein
MKELEKEKLAALKEQMTQVLPLVANDPPVLRQRSMDWTPNVWFFPFFTHTHTHNRTSASRTEGAASPMPRHEPRSRSG